MLVSLVLNGTACWRAEFTAGTWLRHFPVVRPAGRPLRFHGHGEPRKCLSRRSLQVCSGESGSGSCARWRGSEALRRPASCFTPAAQASALDGRTQMRECRLVDVGRALLRELLADAYRDRLSPARAIALLVTARAERARPPGQVVIARSMRSGSSSPVGPRASSGGRATQQDGSDTSEGSRGGNRPPGPGCRGEAASASKTSAGSDEAPRSCSRQDGRFSPWSAFLRAGSGRAPLGLPQVRWSDRKCEVFVRVSSSFFKRSWSPKEPTARFPVRAGALMRLFPVQYCATAPFPPRCLPPASWFSRTTSDSSHGSFVDERLVPR